MLVATYNAHRGRGPAGARFRPDRILGVLAEIRPDLAALQEAQHYLRRGTPMLDPAGLERLGLRPLPVAQQPGHQGWRGNLLLVRHDARVLEEAQGLRLGGLEPRGGILAVVDLGAGPFRVAGVHLSLTPERRRRQAETLLHALATGPGRALPTLLLGDMNEWRAGPGGALGVLAPVFGTPLPAPTFPAFRPLASLDRILGHPAAMVGAVAVHDTALARRASDHLPLTARVTLPGPDTVRPGRNGPAGYAAEKKNARPRIT